MSFQHSQIPLARHAGLVVQEMPDETLIYDLDGHKAYCLNQTAASVWQACDGKTSVADIIREFEAGGNGKASEDLVWLALDQINASGLLANTIERPSGGQTRRQMIRKIGLATAVALPVISSLVTPQNAMASASCACVSPGDCGAQAGCPSLVNCNPSGVCAP